MSSAVESSAASPVGTDAVEFESQLQISPTRVEKLARQSIGAYHLVPEPTRDMQLALKSLGFADEVVFRRLEGRNVFLSPQPGVPVERFNQILLVLDRRLGDRTAFITGAAIALTCAVLVVALYWLKINFWPEGG
jgi:hypothetical protein